MSDDEYKKIFSRNLIRCMEASGKKQIDIINDLGINRGTVSSWVNGLRLPRMEKVELLARYFGVRRSDLIEDKNIAAGSALVLSSYEKELVRHYRVADAGTQAAVDKLLDLPDSVLKSEAG